MPTTITLQFRNLHGPYTRDHVVEETRDEVLTELAHAEAAGRWAEFSRDGELELAFRPSIVVALDGKPF